METYREIDWKQKLSYHLDFESLRDSADGLEIFLSHGGGSAVIKFWNPLAYRNCDEGKRLKTLSELHVREGIYVVENSTLAAWLHEESGYTGDMNLVTYAVVTINDWIEVVCSQPPEIVTSS
ncbi:MAG: hypothetical protein ACTHN5_22320 [Phycisphaerae bacterium]